jgi:hypothetical protein
MDHNLHQICSGSTALLVRGAVRKYCPKFFFLETTTTVIIKFTYIMCTSFTKLRSYFSTVFFVVNKFFHLCMRHCMLVAKNSLLKRQLSSHTLCFSLSLLAKWRPWSASFTGPKGWKLERAKSGLQGGWRLGSPSCLAEPFEFVV